MFFSSVAGQPLYSPYSFGHYQRFDPSRHRNKFYPSAVPSGRNVGSKRRPSATRPSLVLLIEYVGRLFSNGKARIDDGVKDVLKRLGTSAEFGIDRIKKMLEGSDLRGCS